MPRGRREHVSWLATLTPAGIGESLLVPGAVDRAAFDAFVERLLAPSLRPGQVVVLDNLSVRKSPRAKAAVERAGRAGCRLVFLPTYSPDWNPIEHAFAKCTQALRRLGPRSFDAVVAAVSLAPASVAAADARGFVRAAGDPARPPRLSGTALVSRLKPNDKSCGPGSPGTRAEALLPVPPPPLASTVCGVSPEPTSTRGGRRAHSLRVAADGHPVLVIARLF